MSINSRQLLTLLITAAITACSGGGGGGPTPTTADFSGRVVDAPLANSLVFYDANRNLQHDPSEPSVRSDAQGLVNLDSISQQCTATGCDAAFVSLGGTDVLTGIEQNDSVLVFNLTSFSTRPSFINISPLSTIIALTGEEDRVLNAINGDIDAENALYSDPWQQALNGNANAQKIARANAQMGTLMAVTKSLFPANTSQEVLNKLSREYASAIDKGLSPLSNEAALAELIENTAAGLSRGGVSSSITQTVAQALHPILAAIADENIDIDGAASQAIIRSAQEYLLTETEQLRSGTTSEAQYLAALDLVELHKDNADLFESLPDTDKDGIPDILDNDDDGDGHRDGVDSFPKDDATQKAVFVKTRSVDASTSNCPNGGVDIESGIDENGNGILDTNEIDSVETVCNGSRGLSSLVKVSTLASGATCSAGGVQFESGIDNNGNGLLDSTEVEATQVVCNGNTGSTGETGAAGSDGITHIVVSQPLVAGTRCQFGGVTFHSGPDSNNNGSLEASEIESTSDLCGPAVYLFNTGAIEAGDSCVNGGIFIESGIDLNTNNTLDSSEVTSTENICNGGNGNNALIELSPIQAGSICTNGGTLLSVGADLNNDGSLDQNEISDQKTLCNAIDGSDGQNGENGNDGIDGLSYLIDLSPEDSGANCNNGGVRIDAGPDSNDDGVLSPQEIESTAYVCNGQNGSDGGTNNAPEVPAVTELSTRVNQPITGQLSATDAEGDRISFEIVDAPNEGELTQFNAMSGAFEYTPPNNQTLTASFSYRADDGRTLSDVSVVEIVVSEKAVPAGHFQVDSTNLQIIDFPDGETERTFDIEGITQGGVVRGDLEQPAALAGENLYNLAYEDTPSAEPRVQGQLIALPSSSGQTSITITFLEGGDADRELGEFQLQFTYVYDWEADGTMLSVSPTPNADAYARYFTRDGTLAIDVTLDNESANVFSVVDQTNLRFLVAGLFDEGQLTNIFKSEGIEFGDGSYFYQVDFSGFPLVDAFGLPIEQFEGQFFVSRSPVPTTQSRSTGVPIAIDQIATAQVNAAAFGGTGPLSFIETSPALFANISLDGATGVINYQPAASGIFVDDAIAYKVNDGLLDSNISVARFNMNKNEDRSLTPSNLKATYVDYEGKVKLEWTDNLSDELGYRVEQYDNGCGCWSTLETLAAADGTGVPFLWQSSLAETRVYRVTAILPEQELQLAPGEVVANVANVPTLSFDQESSFSGIVYANLSGVPVLKQASYYVDLKRQCTASSWPDFSCRIDTTRLADGSHLIEVDVELQQRSYIRLRETFETFNEPTTEPDETIRVSSRLHTGSSSNYTPEPGNYELQIYPTYSAGIDQVEVTLNDHSTDSLATPNSRWASYSYSLSYCETNPNHYRCRGDKNAYTFQYSDLEAGTHHYEYLITANDTVTREGAGTILVPLAITLNQPASDEVSGPTLTVSGSVESRNPVVVSISLSDQMIYTASGKSFSTSYDMSGLPAGNYTLRVTAREQSGGNLSSTITRTLNYTP